MGLKGTQTGKLAWIRDNLSRVLCKKIELQKAGIKSFDIWGTGKAKAIFYVKTDVQGRRLW